MTQFVPDDYVSTKDALLLALKRWFSRELEDLEAAGRTASCAFPPDPVRDATIGGRLSPEVEREFLALASDVEKRIRNALYKKELTCYYLSEIWGECAIPAQEWATTNTDGVLWGGGYYPLGRPANRWSSVDPERALFKKSDFDRAQAALHPRAPARGAAISDEELTEFVVKHADGQKAEEQRQRAEAHFAESGRTMSRDQWRQAWRQVPAEKKRPRGESDRVRRASSGKFSGE
jgi:hypothetical protein